MSKTVKWILGIIIAILVVGALVGAGFLATNRFYGHAWMMGDLDRHSWDSGQINPRGVAPWGDMPMHPYNRMGDIRFFRFLPFGGLFIGLICLGGLALLIFGIVALVVSLTRSRKPAALAPAGVPPAPQAVQPASPPIEEIQEPVDTTPARLCPSCAQPVNDDWSHCPYCGSALTEA
jgi:hypothetical protein